MSITAKIMGEEKEPYYIGEVSSSEEEEDAKSSEDELEVFMKRDFRRENEDSNGSYEDEFEKEMQMELDAAMKSHESADIQQDSFSICKTEDSNTTSNKLNGPSKKKKSFYDEDYFSSGSEEDENKVGGQASKSDDRRKMLDDVELFYDPGMDDEDEQWVNRQRHKHRQKGNLDSRRKSGSTSDTKDQVDSLTVSHTGRADSSQKAKPEKPLSSDAILSCPACLSMLCIDCQRHEIYNNQYRAMFVMNCHIVDDEVLRYEIPNQIQKPGKKRKTNQKGKLVAANTGSETETNQPGTRECYKPVRCTECNTEVAVYDEDEVYHFFNIVASHA